MNDPAPSKTAPTLVAAPGRGWRFFAPFVAQTVGAAIIYWNVVPLYREAVAETQSFAVELETSLWPILAIVLIQAGFWLSRRARLPSALFTNAFLGQCVLFLARMGFVLPTSIFGLVFIGKTSAVHIPVFRYAIILAGLFSLYCYMQELERLGHALLGHGGESK
jgi:hypothetical protein